MVVRPHVLVCQTTFVIWKCLFHQCKNQHLQWKPMKYQWFSCVFSVVYIAGIFDIPANMLKLPAIYSHVFKLFCCVYCRYFQHTGKYIQIYSHIFKVFCCVYCRYFQHTGKYFQIYSHIFKGGVPWSALIKFSLPQVSACPPARPSAIWSVHPYRKRESPS